MTGKLNIRRIIGEALRIALPFFRSEERWIACGLLAAAAGAQLALIGIAVAENYWRNAFFQSLQDKSWPGFVQQFWVYVVIGIGFVLANVYQRYLTQWLTIRWRRWLTARYLDRWLDGPVHYRAMIVPGTIDNPDQRIAEDIRQFIELSLSLTVGLLGAVARLLSFVAVLWTVSRLVPLTLFGEAYIIPGYLVWAALLYAVLGTVITHGIGRSLIALDFEQERREAEFRFALVRLRENAESVALLQGEASEKQDLLGRFGAIAQNWYRLMSREQVVGLFTGSYRRFSLYFPYFAMSPLYFGGGMQLGTFMQSGSAFNEVRDSFSYLISSYLKIAELSAVVQRLSQFDAVIDAVAFPPPTPARDAQTGVISLAPSGLTVRAPTGKVIAELNRLNVLSGEAVLLKGVSGAGKTSLIRTFAGIWPYTDDGPQLGPKDSLTLPQRAYLPLGSLRRALTYPGVAALTGDAECNDALGEVGLGMLEGSLDVIDAWDKRLSEGEKQRLSIARALLIRPTLLLLDEATNALDEMSEVALHRLIRERLPHATIIAISHSAALSEVYDREIRITRPQAI